MPRYVRFTLFGKSRWGLVEGDVLRAVSHGPLEGGTPRPEGDPLPWDPITLHPPTVPSKIVCVGRNYAAHAAELGHAVPSEPLIFLKPPSCLLPHGGDIVYPTRETRLVHHEGELGVVIGRRARRVSEGEALDHVLGYTIVNDVTARDLQRKDVQFTRAKSFDTFGPVGPWVDTDFAPAGQRLTVTVGDEVRQDGTLDQMVFDVAILIAWISRIMTLEPGDLIATGTPEGVGPLAPGDVVEVAIEGLGALRNRVVADLRPAA